MKHYLAIFFLVKILLLDSLQRNSTENYMHDNAISVTNLNDAHSSGFSAFSINESNTDSDFDRENHQFSCNEDFSEKQYFKNVSRKKVCFFKINFMLCKFNLQYH